MRGSRDLQAAYWRNTILRLLFAGSGASPEEQALERYMTSRQAIEAADLQTLDVQPFMQE
jgi:hypothetical protein